MKLLILFCLSCTLWANSPYSQELIERLKQTEPENFQEIISHLKVTHKKQKDHYELKNIFFPRYRTNTPNDWELVDRGVKNHKLKRNGEYQFFHNQEVHTWALYHQNLQNRETVCAVKFLDSAKKRYRLQTFETSQLALDAGYIVTHQYPCGACSSLKDLAIYMEKADIIGLARKCSSKFGAKKILKCHMEEIGLSSSCSQMWSYNSLNTKNICMNTCIQDYGLQAILSGNYPDQVIIDGELRPCVLCDELKSGPGYAYSAGRTRRSSGIISGIPRRPEEIFPVDHTRYFED